MDTAVVGVIAAERDRQQHELELIASENYVSPAVIDAYANVFTNKYSEGYPGRRYYGGQVWVDALERLCQWRALHIFGLQQESCVTEQSDEPPLLEDDGYEKIQNDLASADWAVNVQPLSGSPANLAVYLGVLQPGDTILGMDLAAGGHLTHGHPLNASGIYYTIKAYGVDKKTHRIDYDHLLEQALTHQPQLILAGFSAYPRDINWQKFDEIAQAVQEKHGYRPILMADIAHIAGLIAGGLLEDPFPHMDIVTTTTHKTLRGPRGGLIYSRKGKLERNGKTHTLPKEINRGVFPGVQGGPHEHIIASKAVAFGEILYKPHEQLKGGATFGEYAERVVAHSQLLAEELTNYGRPIITGGTDNHLLVVDVTKRDGSTSGLTGKIAEQTLEQIGISCNKNMIPFDERSPLDPSGLRLGSAAITTRGLGSDEIRLIAECIDQALRNHDNKAVLAKMHEKIAEICTRFPLPY